MAVKKDVKKSSSIFDEFEPTSTKAIKKIAEVEDSEMSTGKGGNRIELVDGINKIRFWPKRKGEKNFYLMRGRHWYTILDPEGKKNETVRKVVPDARMHAGMDKDISELYLEYITENLDADDAADSRKLKKAAGTNYNGGLQASIDWVAYASHVKSGKVEKPGEFEFKRSVRDALNAEMFVEDEDEAIETDPFTSPKDGRYVQITYNSKAKKSTDYYKVRVSDNKAPITEEELIAFSKMPRLSDLPYFSYRIQDFETALEGLRYYDEENEINLFDSDGFQEVIEDYKKKLLKKLGGSDVEDDDQPFEDDEESTSKNKKATSKAKAKPSVEEEEEEEETEEEEVEEEESTEEGDEFDAMDRDELKQYKVDNELDIKIFKGDSDDDIRNKIREAIAANTEEEPTEEEEVEEEEPEEKSAKKTTTAKKGKLSLEDIKKKLAGK